LGLAWETLGGELVMLEVAPESAQQMVLEAGICMGFDQVETQNYVLWRKIESLFNCGD
jgi:hypothetical protein